MYNFSFEKNYEKRKPNQVTQTAVNTYLKEKMSDNMTVSKTNDMKIYNNNVENSFIKSIICSSFGHKDYIKRSF